MQCKENSIIASRTNLASATNATEIIVVDTYITLFGHYLQYAFIQVPFPNEFH